MNERSPCAYDSIRIRRDTPEADAFWTAMEARVRDERDAVLHAYGLAALSDATPANWPFWVRPGDETGRARPFEPGMEPLFPHFYGDRFAAETLAAYLLAEVSWVAAPTVYERCRVHAITVAGRTYRDEATDERLGGALVKALVLAFGIVIPAAASDPVPPNVVRVAREVVRGLGKERGKTAGGTGAVDEKPDVGEKVH